MIDLSLFLNKAIEVLTLYFWKTFISTKLAFANILEKINYSERLDWAKYSNMKSQFTDTTANYTNKYTFISTNP